MRSPGGPAARLATRLSFLAAGFALACWAPLVPFAKVRLDIGDGALGLLLLCLGIGSVVAMPLAGMATARLGAKPIIVISGLLMALFLPPLAIASTPAVMGAVLLAFGAALGSLEVGINVHALDVERAAGRPLMSGFHGHFSIGGFAGSGLMTLFLSYGVSPLVSTLFGCAVLAATILIAAPRLLASVGGGEGPLLMLPRGIVLVLAVLCAVAFLAEGAILDWGALLITGGGLVETAQGGVGYMLFSLAMTAGRLRGDWLVARIGNRNTLLWGGLAAVAGFAVLITAPVAAVALGGFVLIGLGASNIVPVLFRQAGAQTAMPASLAVAAITTMGYAGILLGPALVGFVAHGVGLGNAFWLLAGLMALFPLLSRTVAAVPAR